MAFVTKPVAKIQANLTGTTTSIVVDGITAADTLDETTATTEINKVLDVVGKEITSTGMKRILTQEVSNNG